MSSVAAPSATPTMGERLERLRGILETARTARVAFDTAWATALRELDPDDFELEVLEDTRAAWQRAYDGASATTRDRAAGALVDILAAHDDGERLGRPMPYTAGARRAAQAVMTCRKARRLSFRVPEYLIEMAERAADRHGRPRAREMRVAIELHLHRALLLDCRDRAPALLEMVGHDEDAFAAFTERVEAHTAALEQLAYPKLTTVDPEPPIRGDELGGP